MEDLLQAVTSVRRDLQERKLSRLKQDTTSTYEYRLSLASPKMSSIHHVESISTQPKTFQRVPAIRIPTKPQDEFSRYMQSTPHSASITKSSPIRTRSYKLDAAHLLVSRVSKFVGKHFQLWKKIADKEKNLETRLFNNKDLVFKVNINVACEKKRYAREKSSDDEYKDKAHTSRFSPRSHGFIPLPGNLGRKHLSVDIEENHFNAGERKKIPEKVLPSSTRAGSAISRKSWEKPKKSMILVLKKFSKTLIATVQKVKKKFFKALTKGRSLKMLLKVFNFPLKAGFMSLKNLTKFEKVEQGVEILNKMYLNSVSEQFYFMKFRSVVESGFMDESGLIESSQDNLKEYIENIEKSRNLKTKNSSKHKSISYMVSAPSFMNLMNELEIKVLGRYFNILLYKIEDQYWGVCGIISALSRVLRGTFEDIQSKGRGTHAKMNGIKKISNLKKRKITLAVNAASKRIKTVIEAGFLQWKSVSLTENNLIVLKLETLIEVFCSIKKGLKKSIFNVYSGIKYKKHLKKPIKSKSFAGGVKIMNRYLISYKRNIFYQFIHLKSNPASKSLSRLPQSLYFLYTQLLHKLRFSFRTWSKHSLNSSLFRTLSLKSLCQIHKHLLSIHFYHWKQLPNN